MSDGDIYTFFTTEAFQLGLIGKMHVIDTCNEGFVYKYQFIPITFNHANLISWYKRNKRDLKINSFSNLYLNVANNSKQMKLKLIIYSANATIDSFKFLTYHYVLFDDSLN